MKYSSSSSSRAFTIVELLVVIVVIAILAAISLAVYSGIQNRAATTVLISDLRNAATQLGKDNVLEGTYPATMTAADEGRGLQTSPGTTFQYTYTAATNSYCLTATSNRTGIPAYMISSDTPTPREGVCPGHTGPDAGGVVLLLRHPRTHRQTGLSLIPLCLVHQPLALRLTSTAT